jgi:hypothetical protein
VISSVPLSPSLATTVPFGDTASEFTNPPVPGKEPSRFLALESQNSSVPEVRCISSLSLVKTTEAAPPDPITWNLPVCRSI